MTDARTAVIHLLIACVWIMGIVTGAMMMYGVGLSDPSLIVGADAPSATTTQVMSALMFIVGTGASLVAGQLIIHGWVGDSA